MKFFGHVLSTFATEMAIVALNFLAGILVARLLPPNERGILALVTLLPVTLAYFADIGVSQSTIYLIGRRKLSAQGVAGNALSLALIFGGGTAILVWLLRDQLLLTFLKDVPPAYFGVVLALLPLLLVDTYLLSILRARLQFIRFNLRRLLTPLFFLIGIILLVWGARWGVRGAVAAFVASTLLSLALAAWIVGRQVPLSLRFNPPLAREALGYGVKSYLQNLVGHLHYRLDIYLLALFLPPAQVAYYTVATSVAEAIFYIPDSVGTVLFPRLSVEEDSRIPGLTAEVARHTLWITAVASLGVMAVAWWVIPLVFGGEYRAAVAPFYVLMPGVLAMAVYKVLTRNFSSRNRQQVSVIAAGLALLLNVGLNLFLIPRLGTVGAALASLISYTVAAAILLAVFTREAGFSLRQVLILERADLGRYSQVWKRIRRAAPAGPLKGVQDFSVNKE